MINLYYGRANARPFSGKRLKPTDRKTLAAAEAIADKAREQQKAWDLLKKVTWIW